MNKKQIRIGAFLSYATILFNIGSGLIYTPWLIEVVGDDHYALYTLAMSVVNVFLLDFGIGSAVTKFISNYYARGEEQEITRFLGIVYKIFFAISAGIALGMILFYSQIHNIYKSFSTDNLIVFKRLFLIVALYSVVSFPFTTFNGILMSGERFIELKCCSFAQKVLEVAVIIFLLMKGTGVYAVVLTHAVSNAIFLGIKYYLIRTKMKIYADFLHWDLSIAKELFSFSSWYTIMNIARRCIYNIMPTVIATLANSEAVVVFSLASALEGYAFTLTDAINGMFMPHVSRILNSKEHGAELQHFMIKVAKYHIYTLGLLVIGFACVGGHFVALWVGESYSLIYPCALLLLFPSVVETPQQIARTALVVNNIVKPQAILYIIMAGVNLLLSWMLIPPYGVLGAAMSVSISYIVKTVGLNWMYVKYLHVNLRTYFKDTYGKWFIYALITLLIGMWINEHVTIEGWLGLAVKTAAITVLYLSLMLNLAFTKEKWNTLREKILRKLGN